MGRLHALVPLLIPHFDLHWGEPLYHNDSRLRIQVCKHGWYLGLVTDFGTYVRVSSGVYNLIARIEVAWCDPQMVERIVEFFSMVLKHRDDERQRELEYTTIAMGFLGPPRRAMFEATTATLLQGDYGNC